MVTYEFQNDAEAIDALAGVNLTIDSEKGIVRRARILSVVAAALFCLAAVLSKEPLIYLAGAAALLVLGYLTKSIRKRVIVKTIMKKSGDYLNGHATWTFAEDKIHTESNLGDGDAYWSAVQDYGDYDRYLYIRRKDGSMYLLDRTRLSDQDLTELRDLLTRKVAA